MPVTVAEWSKTCTVFARSDAGDRGFECHSGLGCLVFVYVCAFFCVCIQVERPCDELITRPRSPPDCLRSRKLK
jgi:hypothetical protein